MSLTNGNQLEQFEKTTSLWGPITMVSGLLVSVAGPAYLVFFTDLEVPISTIVTAFTAIAMTFGVIWITEPITYYPVLGQASMYQAFMIGNTANKLLPAALTAQETLKVPSGSKKSELVIVMAICGAAFVHLASLLIFVGILGSWLISFVPQELLSIVSSYTLPTIMGAMCVQSLFSSQELRASSIALTVTAFSTLVVVPALAGISSVFGLLSTPISVLFACLAAWFLRRNKKKTA